MLKFLGKTLIVSAAVIAIPIVLMKRIKKLDSEGFFEKDNQEEKEEEYNHKKFPHFSL